MSYRFHQPFASILFAMSSPRISVVVPTCNRNDALAQCLDRLAPGAQTLSASQYEVIVTDDGSSDDGAANNAQEMMRERYPWAIWTAGPRRGPAANRNRGASRASGQWLAFTDDDCLPAPAWLAAFNQSIAPQTLVYEGKTTCEAGLSSPLETAPVNLSGGYLWSCNLMIERALFEEMGGFDERFPGAHMEDVDLRQRIQARGLTFPFVLDAVVDHPPRRRAWGTKLGAQAQSNVVFDAKHGIERSNFQLLLSIAKMRLRTIKVSPKGKDSLWAAASLLAEIGYILPRLSRWKKRHFSRTR